MGRLGGRLDFFSTFVALKRAGLLPGRLIKVSVAYFCFVFIIWRRYSFFYALTCSSCLKIVFRFNVWQLQTVLAQRRFRQVHLIYVIQYWLPSVRCLPITSRSLHVRYTFLSWWLQGESKLSVRSCGDLRIARIDEGSSSHVSFFSSYSIRAVRSLELWLSLVLKLLKIKRWNLHLTWPCFWQELGGRPTSMVESTYS